MPEPEIGSRPEPESTGSGLTTTVSCQMKVNTGNYESADAFVSISGVTPFTTENEIDEMLLQSRVVFNKIAATIMDKATALKQTVQEERNR